MTCTSTCIQPSPTNAHCGACHVTFGSIGGFDRHRRGGECLNPANLPMHSDHRGIWRWDGQDPHVDASAAACGEPRGSETRSGAPRDTPRSSEAAETISGGSA